MEGELVGIDVWAQNLPNLISRTWETSLPGSVERWGAISFKPAPINVGQIMDKILVFFPQAELDKLALKGVNEDVRDAAKRRLARSDVIVLNNFETRVSKIGYTVYKRNDGSSYDNGLIVETNTPEDGNEALSIHYDNTVMPYCTEAKRTYTQYADWTLRQVNSLMLHVRGAPDNAADPLYIAVEDTAGQVAIVHADLSLINSVQWTEWSIPLSKFSDAGVNLTAVKNMTVGIGDHNGRIPGGSGMIFVDRIRLVKPAYTHTAD